MKNHILFIFLLMLIYFCLPKPAYAYQTIPSYTNETTLEVDKNSTPKKNNSYSIQSLQWMFKLFIFLFIALSVILIFSSFF